MKKNLEQLLKSNSEKIGAISKQYMKAKDIPEKSQSFTQKVVNYANNLLGKKDASADKKALSRPITPLEEDTGALSDYINQEVNRIVQQTLDSTLRAKSLTEIGNRLSDVQSKLYGVSKNTGDISDEGVRLGLVQDTPDARAKFRLDYRKNSDVINKMLDKREKEMTQMKYNDLMSKYKNADKDEQEEIDKMLDDIHSGRYLNSLSILPVLE